MAHFAKIEQGLVTQVIVIDDSLEASGQDFINTELKLEGTWIQTSYNTRANKHATGGTPLRMNYAGIGYTYDSELDAFLPPKPYPSWVLDEDKGIWNAPVESPGDDSYVWNEELTDWEAMKFELGE